MAKTKTRRRSSDKKSKKGINKNKKASSKSAKPRKKRKLSKTALIKMIATNLLPKLKEHYDLDNSDSVKITKLSLESLSEIMQEAVSPSGPGEFMLPTLLKISCVEKPAIKKGTMVRNPGTGGMVPSKGRPASNKVKIRPLVALKRAAAGA